MPRRSGSCPSGFQDQSWTNRRDGMCRCRAVTRIYPDQLQFINEPRFLDYVSAALAGEIKEVARANMRLEDYNFYDGIGKIAIFDIYYIKGGDT